MKCRSCDSENLSSIIPLGSLPLANALAKQKSNAPANTYNLEVLLCSDCGLAQLKDLINPAELFTDYVYFSSNSETMLHSAYALTKSIISKLNSDSFVVEIASNDGYLLKNYVKSEIKCLGIDPAKNIAKVANQTGIPTLCDFFSETLSKNLYEMHGGADVIHANNVMAHVPDINDFIKGLKVLLKPSGFCVIEVPYFNDLVAKLEFDTIYHEHVYYFSVKPLEQAFKKHGLEIYDIENLTIHGGTLRLFVGHNGIHPVQSIVQELIQEEIQSRLYEIDTYTQFMNKLFILKNSLFSTLNTLKKQGKKIAAYGASAKGTTLLNYFGIGKDILEFVVDRSTTKQGMYTPGTQLSIHSPNALIQNKINYALLLSWNFIDEILKQQQAFTASNGKFIIPLPEVRVI